MNELVSIITPTYHSVAFITETVASVQAQTHSNWELLLIDDCSQDGTYALLQELAAQDARIRVFRNATNQGAAVTRNVGITEAKGRYLAFLDADDCWLPEFLSRMIAFSQANNYPFVFSSYERMDELGNRLYPDIIAPEKINYRTLLKANKIGCLTAFLDLELAGKKQMPLIRKRQDMGLWLAYLKEIPYAYSIAEPLAKYRVHTQSLSSNKRQLIQYQWELYRQVEQLSVIESTYYMLQWMVRGYLKYRN